MVRRWSFPSGEAYSHGQTVKLPGSKGMSPAQGPHGSPEPSDSLTECFVGMQLIGDALEWDRLLGWAVMPKRLPTWSTCGATTLTTAISCYNIHAFFKAWNVTAWCHNKYDDFCKTSTNVKQLFLEPNLSKDLLEMLGRSHALLYP